MICPKCSSAELRPHCRDRETGEAMHCDWIVCDGCHGYGKPDGSRWKQRVAAPKK